MHVSRPRIRDILRLGKQSHDVGHLIGHAVSPNEIRGPTKFRSTNNFVTREKIFKEKGFSYLILSIFHIYIYHLRVRTCIALDSDPK